MNIPKNIKAILLLIALTSSLAKSEEFKFTVLHTNDLHSYVEGVGPGDLNSRLGGHARLVTAIQNIKNQLQSKGEEALLVDAGDFYSGTLFHSLAPRKEINSFPEYEFFEHLKYDAVTLGNHEFDAEDRGFSNMLEKILTSKYKVPIVSSNIYLSDKRSYLNKYVGKGKLVSPYIIKSIKYNGEIKRIGIIGLLGPNGCLVSRATRKKGVIRFTGFDDKNSKEHWDDLFKKLQELVDFLKNEEKVDFTMAVMHGGSRPGGESEDKLIAENLNGLDILIAGHTHRRYQKFVGKTFISQTGSFGRNLGVLKFKIANGKLVLRNPNDNFISIDSSIRPDADYSRKISKYKQVIQTKVLNKIGYKFETKIFVPQKDYQRRKEELNEMGVFVTESIRSELNSKLDNTVDIYFSSLGLIRNDIKKNKQYYFSDIFEILPIGFGENFSLGSPIVSFYFNKSEVRKLILFMEFYAGKSPTFTPAFSKGLTYKNRDWSIPFIFQIKNLKFDGLSYEKWPDLLHIATTDFVASYIDMVERVTWGLVKFIPKDKNGRPLKELKKYPYREYEMLANHLKKFPNKY